MGMKPSPPQLIRDAELIKCALSGENGTVGAGHKRQELCRILGSLLLTDLDFALDKKAEQDLWNLAFRIPIQALQNKTKELKGNSGTQSQLTNLLETATGFYLQLLQNLCWVYNLNLPCNPAEHFTNKALIAESHQAAKQPGKTSLLYICQHCLVHLGDLARYRGQSLQAENFYRHALDISPNNGQPYNQLALLEAASGEKLSSVLYYMRSLAVQYPFPVAATNLHKLFSNILATEGLGGEAKTRHTAYEYIQSFLHVHARLHLRSELDTLDKSLSDLALSLPALVIAERLDSWQLVEMVALCLFAWDHAMGIKEHKRCAAVILDLLAGMLNAFLLPLHASLSPRDSTRFFCNPSIKIIFDWLVRQDAPLILREQFLRRPQIWQGFCKLLNDFSSLLPEKWKNSHDEHIPLPEDWDLQCFLPLTKAHSKLKFDSEADPLLSEEDLDHLRASRLLYLGRTLAQSEKRRVITLNSDGSFVAVPCDLTSDIQELSLTNHHPEGGSNGRLDNEISINKEQAQQEVRFQLEENPPEPPRYPEPTIAPSRNDKSQRSLVVTKGGVNRTAGRQNVAMQAILQQRAAATTQLSDNLPSSNVPNDHSLKPSSVAIPRMRLPENFFTTPPPNFPDPQQNSRLVERYPQCRAASIQVLPTGPGNNGDQLSLNSWGQAVPTFQQNTQQQSQQQQNPLAPTTRFIPSQAPPPPQQMVFGGQAANKLVVQPPKPPPPLYGLCPPQPQTAAPLWNYMVPPPNYFMVDNYTYPQTYRQDHHPAPPQPPPQAPSAKHTWSLDDNQLRGYGGGSKPSTASLSQAADSNTYSLFSSSPWPSLPPRKDTVDLKNPPTLNGLSGGARSLDPSSLVVQQRIQSLWSGPGPSPLERLLEQQKLQHRDNGT